MKKSRLVVVETIIHSPFDGQPMAFDNRYARYIDSEEVPFVRRLTLSQDWKLLDLGWVEKVGLLLVKNEEGMKYLPEQTLTLPVLQLAYGDNTGVDASTPHWEILPQETMKGRPTVPTPYPDSPSGLGNIWLRSSKGSCKATIVVFPA